MRPYSIALAALLPSAVHAEVKSVSPGHFEVESKAVVTAAPAEVFTALGQPATWWSKDHTYSGDAANLSLDLRAGGCFCEKVPKGSGTIEHLRIVYAQPGTMLRAQGGLGPLQAEAVAGTLTWTLKPVSGGTEITQTYIVSGHLRGGFEKLAPMVDQVLAEQLSGLQKRLAK